jgi:hypothetical protein
MHSTNPHNFRSGFLCCLMTEIDAVTWFIQCQGKKCINSYKDFAPVGGISLSLMYASIITFSLGQAGTSSSKQCSGTELGFLFSFSKYHTSLQS